MPVWIDPSGAPQRHTEPNALSEGRPCRPLACGVPLAEILPGERLWQLLERLLYSSGMTVLDHPHEMTVTEATQRGVAGLVADAERGTDVVVTRRHKPIAVILAYEHLAELSRTAEDLRDLAMVLARSATDSGRRTSLDDVLAAFGHTRESLAATPDDE